MREFDGIYDMSNRCGIHYQLDYEAHRCCYEELGMTPVTFDVEHFEDFAEDFPPDPWMQNHYLLQRFEDEGVRAVLLSPDFESITFWFEADDPAEWWALFKLKYFPPRG